MRVMHRTLYNRRMRKLARITSALALALAFAFAFAFALSGCTINVNITQQGSSAASTAASAASSSSPAVSSSSSEAAPSSTSEASSSSSSATSSSSSQGGTSAAAVSVTEDGQYSDKDSVALYIHTFGHLPSNYISKTKAKKAGWVSTKGNLWDVLPGMSIGGSEYYNDDGQLPDAKGRRWTECDIDFDGGFRNAKRIVFSNDGLVFYTGDHYKTFEQLY